MTTGGMVASSPGLPAVARRGLACFCQQLGQQVADCLHDRGITVYLLALTLRRGCRGGLYLVQESLIHA